MVMRKTMAIALVALFGGGTSPLVAQQQPTTGSISGRATDEARKPYTDYTVQLRDTETGQVVHTTPLNAEGRYTFTGLELSRRFLVELYNLKEKELVCTEGPFPLAPDANVRQDVNIDCGAAPAALWLLAASAGAVAGIAVTSISGSE